MEPRTFCIVTPTFNSERFLEDTILSIASQAGPFKIRYHIQDGGSKDRTLAIANAWVRRLETGQFPIRCEGISMTVASAPDSGMYQAITERLRLHFLTMRC